MFGRFFIAQWGECTRGRPVPWLAIKLGNGVQQGGYESLRGLCPCPPWSKQEVLLESAAAGTQWRLVGICMLCGLISTIPLEGMEGIPLLLLVGCTMDMMGSLLDHVSGGHTL